MTHSCVYHDSFLCVTEWHVSFLWHDSFYRRVIEFHSYVYNDSFLRVPWLILTWPMSQSHCAATAGESLSLQTDSKRRCRHRAAKCAPSTRLMSDSNLCNLKTDGWGWARAPPQIKGNGMELAYYTLSQLCRHLPLRHDWKIHLAVLHIIKTLSWQSTQYNKNCLNSNNGLWACSCACLLLACLSLHSPSFVQRVPCSDLCVCCKRSFWITVIGMHLNASWDSTSLSIASGNVPVTVLRLYHSTSWCASPKWSRSGHCAQPAPMYGCLWPAGMVRCVWNKQVSLAVPRFTCDSLHPRALAHWGWWLPTEADYVEMVSGGYGKGYQHWQGI